MTPDAAPEAPLLDIRGLVAGYGNLPVLHGLSLSVPRGSMLAVIGPNGAGKSTLAKAVMRIATLMAGEITFDGRPLGRLETQDVAALGLGYVPQTRNVFGTLTVEENLQLGCNLLRTGDRASAVEAVYERFPRLRQRSRQKGASLSGGERQMLAIGSALIGDPRLLILDEPTSGLSPHMTTEVTDGIEAIRRSGKTVIWVVEENPRQVLAIADWVCVMDAGNVRMSRPAAEILAAENFRELFLGV